jgi:hypothetical protein
MGNLTNLIKENNHLKHQNEAIRAALKRKRDELKAQNDNAIAAIRELTELTSAYIGAICLSAGESVEIRHDLIKKVIEEYNVIVTTSETGFTFSIEEKARVDDDLIS